MCAHSLTLPLNAKPFKDIQSYHLTELPSRCFLMQPPNLLYIMFISLRPRHCSRLPNSISISTMLAQWLWRQTRILPVVLTLRRAIYVASDSSAHINLHIGYALAKAEKTLVISHKRKMQEKYTRMKTSDALIKVQLSLHVVDEFDDGTACAGLEVDLGWLLGRWRSCPPALGLGRISTWDVLDANVIIDENSDLRSLWLAYAWFVAPVSIRLGNNLEPSSLVYDEDVDGTS